jgi:hypothetical protein
VDFFDVRITVHFLETRISVRNNNDVETKDWKGVGTRPVAKALQFKKIQIFRDITTCQLVNSYRRFEGQWCLRQGQEIQSLSMSSVCGKGNDFNKPWCPLHNSSTRPSQERHFRGIKQVLMSVNPLSPW